VVASLTAATVRSLEDAILVHEPQVLGEACRGPRLADQSAIDGGLEKGACGLEVLDPSLIAQRCIVASCRGAEGGVRPKSPGFRLWYGLPS
jgi:hypothetical protein